VRARGDDRGQLVVGGVGLVGEGLGLRRGGGAHADQARGADELQEIAPIGGQFGQGEVAGDGVGGIHGVPLLAVGAALVVVFGRRKRASDFVGRCWAHSGTAGSMPSQALRG
jgi:hypothetical protein